MILGFGSSAGANRIGFGPSLALDQIPLSIQFEYDLSEHWSLTTGLGLLTLVNGGATYFWQDSQSGPYTSARAGVGVALPVFSVYVHQGYRFALSEFSALDLEAGAGWVGFSRDSRPYIGTNDFESGVLPSLALRLNIKF